MQGWRETPDGPLWEPGRLVHVTDDWLGLDRELLIAGVQQSIDASGTRTILALTSREAFGARLETDDAPTSGGADPTQPEGPGLDLEGWLWT